MSTDWSRTQAPPRLVHVNTQDVGGDPATVARNLHAACVARGLDSRFAVGRRYGDDPRTLQIPNPGEPNLRRHKAAWNVGQFPPPPRAERESEMDRFSQAANSFGASIVNGARRLRRHWSKLRGRDDFNFAGTWRLLDLAGRSADVFHCHHLLGDYFDLRALSALSQRAPVVLTLHDDLLLCSDDESTARARRRGRIYARCKLHLAAPSRRLLERAQNSILGPGVAEARVIPHGVDQTLFRPDAGHGARWRLGLPADGAVILLAGGSDGANGLGGAPVLRRAVELLAEREFAQPLVVAVLGQCGPTRRVGSAEIRSIPAIRNPALLAEYYRAADLYLHASRDAAFPLSVVEALSCGTPVVADAGGGASEQIASLALFDLAICQRLVSAGVKFSAMDSATGALVPAGDAEAMAEAAAQLLADAALRRRLSVNAARDAQRRFSLTLQVDAYTAWYRELAGAGIALHRRAA